jgi:hypothetical protein
VTVPAVMTPQASVEAARALQARSLVPIHFNRTFEHPDYYRPLADAGQQIEELAAARDINGRSLETGDRVDIGSPPRRPCSKPDWREGGDASGGQRTHGRRHNMNDDAGRSPFDVPPPDPERRRLEPVLGTWSARSTARTASWAPACR